MSNFPNLSNISGFVRTELTKRVTGERKVSELNAWVRISSGVGGGLTLLSNPNFQLFGAAGEGSIYGSGKTSGTLGTNWGGGAVSAESENTAFRPKPSVTSIEIDEGAGTLSRKASFTITCYTKGQLDTLCEYFLEPGYSIFLEWGWNVKDSLATYENVNTAYAAKYQTFEIVNKARAASNGTYDNYLGFITGGGISSAGDTYEISVKCTGFTELPAYFMGADNSEKKDAAGNKISAPEFSTAQISGQTDLGKKRFMMAFNRLPSNRRTLRVAALISNTSVANAANYINVDETVKANVNKCTSGFSIAGVSLNDEEANFAGTSIEFPSGTMIIKDESYIKFGTLMKIINEIGIEGFKIGDSIIKTQINTTTTVCCAFKKIFSTDKTKLFIPNQTAPKFDIVKAVNSTISKTGTGTPPPDPSVDETAVDDCSIKNPTGKLIKFPAAGAITNGIAGGIVVQTKVPGGSFIGLDKDESQWGFLDDLYVNLDFAKGILETKNFSIKNALYQILNGLSSAAGGIWDFQIIPNENETELRVVDLNLTPSGKDEPYTFTLAGYESIFMDASLDIDISGAKMNQIIGSRLGQTINGSQKDIKPKTKGLFTDKTDQILTEVRRRAEPPVSNETTPEGTVEDDTGEARRKSLQLFLDKVGFMPMPDKDDKFDFSVDLTKGTFIVAYNDQSVFEFFKTQNDGSGVGKKAAEIGPIMPIKFTFTIHGVSGIKRGDKFKVLGLPKNYETTGFFQVTSVKHTITDMIWKNDIEGSFRQSR
jgi:hypothetical protein